MDTRFGMFLRQLLKTNRMTLAEIAGPLGWSRGSSPGVVPTGRRVPRLDRSGGYPGDRPGSDGCDRLAGPALCGGKAWRCHRTPDKPSTSRKNGCGLSRPRPTRNRSPEVALDKWPLTSGHGWASGEYPSAQALKSLALHGTLCNLESGSRPTVPRCRWRSSNG